ncbi:MAG: TfoX/Sxy family protein [Prolixibacteraceae bacterium]|nr:TfoX/Sxy family protein [Prolixibacteraceae bacterium]MBN2774126.1 TfoX/Sxy family protein [Prolixibacteraceae bacterium]
MPYDEQLAERIKKSLNEQSASFYEKKMFGGVCFMVDDKMCVGVLKNEMMARIDPEIQDEILKEKGCREMDFTRRPMKGFMFVSPEGIDMDDDLDKWVKRCLDYNPRAKSSKK